MFRSGIISIITYGITAKRFAFQNISNKSYTTVKYATKTLAATSDCIIFLFLGLVLIEENHYFHPGFILSTILFCLVFRFASTFLFSFLVNIGRMEKISLKEQLIMAYGGLRGAVGFSLAMVIQEKVWYRELFLTMDDWVDLSIEEIVRLEEECMRVLPMHMLEEDKEDATSWM